MNFTFQSVKNSYIAGRGSGVTGIFHFIIQFFTEIVFSFFFLLFSFLGGVCVCVCV